MYYPHRNIKTYHARVKYISLLRMNSKTPSKLMEENSPQKLSKTSPSPWGIWTPSIAPMPDPTPLTTPNGSSIGSHAFARISHRLLIGYNGMPHIHPQNYP